MPVGKVVTLSNEILSGLKQKLSSKTTKSFLLSYVRIFQAVPKHFWGDLFQDLSEIEGEYCLFQQIVPLLIGLGFSAKWQHLLQHHKLALFYRVL